jgi:hypothetical protein
MRPPKSALRTSSKTTRIAPVAAALAVSGAVAWYLYDRPPPSPAQSPAVGAAPATSPAEPAGPPPAVEPGRVQSALEAISPSGLFRRGLVDGDVLRRWVVVTDNLAEGVSPRGQLRFLAPARPFSVGARGGRTFIAPESYQRYDEFGDMVASLDVKAVARAYRELYTVLEHGYRALGYPSAKLDQVTARALERIAAAPVVDGEVAVEGSTLFVFSDPRLEALGPVEKHLLRMGPRNTRLVQAKAREIMQALALQPGGAAGAPGQAHSQLPPEKEGR